MTTERRTGGSKPPATGAKPAEAGSPRRHLARSLDGVTLLVAGLAYFGGLARYGYQRAEDGDILQLISRVAHGQQPYIDFASGYTPLFFYWHAALLRAFADNLMAIRWSLVLANSLTLWGLYVLARTAMPAAFAVISPLVYAAIIPVFPGEFCSFNVPYPAWYTTPLTVAAALAMVRWTRDGWPGAAAIAGLAAGLAFSFKPNAGLFALVAAALVLVCVVPPPSALRAGAAVTGEGTRASFEQRRWVRGGLWWMLVLGLGCSISGVFGGHVIDREARVFLWPIFALLAMRVAYRRIAPANGARLAARFVASCIALGLGFAGVTIPWLAYYLVQLGWYRFVHEVLFIGSGYEQFFYSPFHEATKWDYGTVVAAMAVAVVARAVRAGRLRAAIPLGLLAAGAAAAGLYIALLAPMPEGVQRAVASRVQDLSFGLCLLAHWAGVALLWRAWSVAAGRQQALPAAAVRLVTILAPAVAMFLGIYPRSDFMHLIISVAATLVLGALLLSRVATMWTRGRGRRAASALRLGFAVPVVLVAAVLAAPAGRLWWEMRGLGGVRFVSLDLPRAPIVMEDGRHRRLGHLRAAVNYLESVTTADDALFPFPDLNLVNFLTARRNPGRQGYFQPGWPSHAVEAEVVQALRAQQPPYAVVLAAHAPFITAAPAYYFMLREYIGAHYVEAARFGPYVILRRRDLPARAVNATTDAASGGGESAATEASRLPALGAMTKQGVEQVPPDVRAWAGLDDAAVQQAVAALVRTSGDAAAAAALAEAVATAPLSPRARALYLRVVGEVGDTRALPALLRLAGGEPVDDLVASDLYYISSKARIEPFWFVAQAEAPDGWRAADSPALRERLLMWLGEGQDGRLRFFAAWASGVLGEPRARPRLIRMLGGGNENLKAAAAQALAAMSPNPELLDLLVDQVASEDTFIPSIVIELARRDPAAGAPRLARELAVARGQQREALCWIAGALRDPTLTAAVVPGLRDEWPPTRLAAAWALGQLGGAAARQALDAARDDPHPRVRAVVATALQALAQADRLTGS
jgi:HEAT repeat protein